MGRVVEFSSEHLESLKEKTAPAAVADDPTPCCSSSLSVSKPQSSDKRNPASTFKVKVKDPAPGMNL